MKTIFIESLSYEHYLKLQENLRRRRRELLLFCSHPNTLTYGRQAEQKNLLIGKEDLAKRGIQCYGVNRGGDFTAHELGQCVIYPHIDLTKRGLKLSHFTRMTIEVTKNTVETIWPSIQLLYRLEAPGLYLQNHENQNEKLAAIGYNYRSFFSSHGIAINVANDLKCFAYIHPCGYSHVRPTSIRRLNLDISQVGKFRKLWEENFAITLARLNDSSSISHVSRFIST